MSAFPFHPKLSNVRHGARVGHVLSLGIRDMDHQLVRAVFVCVGGVTTRPPGPGTRCHVTLSPFISRAGSGPDVEMQGIVQTDHQECGHHHVQIMGREKIHTLIVELY